MTNPTLHSHTTEDERTNKSTGGKRWFGSLAGEVAN